MESGYWGAGRRQPDILLHYGTHLCISALSTPLFVWPRSLHHHYAPWVLPCYCPAPSILPWIPAIHGSFGFGNSILLPIIWLTLVIGYKSRFRIVIRPTGGQPSQGGRDEVRGERGDQDGSPGCPAEMLKLMPKSTLDLGPACPSASSPSTSCL